MPRVNKYIQGVNLRDFSQEESRGITGVPDLGTPPGLSGTTNRKATKDIMELALVITPHLVRRAHQRAAGSMRLLPRQ